MSTSSQGVEVVLEDKWHSSSTKFVATLKLSTGIAALFNRTKAEIAVLKGWNGIINKTIEHITALISNQISNKFEDYLLNGKKRKFYSN